MFTKEQAKQIEAAIRDSLPKHAQLYIGHHRPTDWFENVPQPKGGYTTVEITLPPAGPWVATGIAICHPTADNFSRREGRVIALKRARRAFRRMCLEHQSVTISDDKKDDE